MKRLLIFLLSVCIVLTSVGLVFAESPIDNEGSFIDVRKYGAVGDGETDNACAFQMAFDKASNDSGVVFVPAGKFKISDPVNMKGASVLGMGPTVSIIIADPETPPEDWKITHNDNDVAMLYAINQSDWTVSNVQVDLQDSYVAGVAVFGGSGITYTNVYAKNSANSALQFIGNRVVGHDPIRDSKMIGNYSEGSRWNYVIDGTAYNVSIIGNTSKNATNRHISLDPREALDKKEMRGIIVSNNTIEGRRDFPNAWLEDPSPAKGPDYAIGTKANSWVSVTGNYIRNWTDVAEGGEIVRRVAGLGVRGAGGIWSNNVIQNDMDNPMSIGIRVVEALPNARIDGNIILGSKVGIELDKSQKIEISRNTIDHTTGEAITNIDELGDGTQLLLNYATQMRKYIGSP